MNPTKSSFWFIKKAVIPYYISWSFINISKFSYSLKKKNKKKYQ